ncbi:MAG: HD domain-containing protein [Nitrospirae bacterium]|nr:HD domain-containing protein [Nitrospirota bacterium]
MIGYMAHSANKSGNWHRLSEHIRNVARIAGEFASMTRLADEAYLAGIMHDFGKYGDAFQSRLIGEEKGIDH